MAKDAKQEQIPGTESLDQEYVSSLNRRLNASILEVGRAEKALREARKRERDLRGELARLEDPSGPGSSVRPV